MARLTDERPDVGNPFVSVRDPFGRKAHGQVDHVQPRRRSRGSDQRTDQDDRNRRKAHLCRLRSNKKQWTASNCKNKRRSREFMKYFYIINISVLLHTSSSSSLRIIRITLYLTVQAPAIGLRLLYWTESYRGSTIIREIARVSPFSGTVKICTYVALVQARKEETRRGTLYNLIQNSGEKPPVLREEGQLRMTVRAEATYGILFQSATGRATKTCTAFSTI